MAVAQPASAQQKGAEERAAKPLADFDIRASAAPQPAALSAEGETKAAAVAGKLATLVDEAGRPVRYTLNSEGWPKMISSSAGLTGPSDRDPESIARDFLSSSEGASPFSLEDLANLRLRSRSSAGVLQVVHLRQYASGVPVYRSSVKIAVDPEGRVRSATFSDPSPGLRLATPIPSISAAEAARLALASIGVAVEGPLKRQSAENGRLLFLHPSGAPELPVSVDLTALPLRGGVGRLAWRVYADNGPGSYEILIAADDPAVLVRTNLTEELGSGRVFPVTPLGPSETREFGEGWLAEGATVTTGNNADAYADIDGNDQPDIIPTPGLQNGRASSESQQFDFDPGNGRNAGRTTRAGAIVNAFYHVNRAHDFFYGLGFGEAEGNFQTDNFGRGGEGGDAVPVEVHDLDVRNNATFRPRPDGVVPRLQLGLWTFAENEVRDFALDAPTIVHEYTHGVTSRAVGGPDDVSCLSSMQADALSEGWSDYFGASLYNATVLGDYITGDMVNGIRRAAIDQNPRTYADLGEPRFQAHADGEVWAATLWEIRGAIGAEAADRLILQALLLTTCSPTYVDARDAILAVDAGTHEAALWTVFAKRGLGFAASGSNSRASVGTVFNANYDMPPALAAGNRSPQVTSIPQSPAIFGERFTYTVRAIDADGDARTYALVSGPEGVTVDPATGEVVWQNPVFTPQRFQIAVMDGNGGRTVHGFQLRVEANLTLDKPIRISGARSSIGLAFVTIPAETEILQVRLRGDSGDADLVLFSPSFNTEFSSRSESNETLSIVNPAAGEWIVRVDGASAYQDAELSVALVTPTELTLPGEAKGLSEARSGETFFKVVVPEGTPLLRMTLTGNGDPDLLLAKGRIPLCGGLLVSVDCDVDDLSEDIGSYELLALEDPEPGEYFLTVFGYRAFDGVTLQVATAAPDVQLGAAINAAASQDAASHTNAPGGLASLYGAAMTDVTVAATSTPLPKELDGVRVIVDGVEAPLLFVSPGQINFQFPSDILGFLSTLYVTRNGVLSDPISVEVDIASPQIFADPGTGLPIITHWPDNSLVTPDNPVKPGGVVIAYFNGIGFVNDMPVDGETSTSSPLSGTLFTPRATLGGAPVQVLFAGLAPGFVGLAQANLILPDDLPAGPTAPLVLIIDTGFSLHRSAPVNVPVAP